MNNNTNVLLGAFCAFLATAAWGIQLPLAKDAFGIVDPFHITAVRYLLAALCLAPFLIWREGWASMWPDTQPWLVLGLGIIGMCGSPMLVFLGMSWSHAEHAVVIVSTQPIIAALTFWLLRGRRPARVTLWCMLLAFTGVICVVTKGKLLFVESWRQLAGDFVIFLGAACWVVYTVGIGRLGGWSVSRITVLTMIPGALATTLLTQVLIVVDVLEFPGVAAFGEVAFEIAYLTFAGVLLAMLAWNYGARQIGAQNATLFINFMPVAAFTFRALQGREFLLIELIGAGLVMLALVANNLYLRRIQTAG